jgi:hypothetical protein
MFLIVQPTEDATQAADTVVPVASTNKEFWRTINPSSPCFRFNRFENCPFFQSKQTNGNMIRCFRTGDSRLEGDHCSIPGYGRSAISVLLSPIQTTPTGGFVGFLWVCAPEPNVFDDRHEQYIAGVATQLSACCSPALATLSFLSKTGGWQL